MKKLVFTVAVAFAFATANQTQAMTLQVDCFEEAINNLEALEAEMGISINDNYGMGLLNSYYADCWLLNGGWEYLENQ